MRRNMVMAVLLLTCSGAWASEPTTAAEYAERGMRYADEFPGLVGLCAIDKPIRDLTKKKGMKKRDGGDKAKRDSKRRSHSIAPTQVFDNLYYVGTGGVASWVLKTSEGLIVIDALNNNKESKKYIDGGLRQLGLDPADIKYLLITHGHGDHYGGQEYLVGRYQPQVVMSEIEWQRLEAPKQDFSSPRWGKAPTRDISIKDGDTLRLGDTEVQLYVTPGHTPGTVSMIFPVYDNGSKHTVSLWGGTTLNYGPIVERIEQYPIAAERFRHIAKEQGVDIYFSNHPTRDGSAERIKALAERKDGEPHPFVRGKEAALHAFDMKRDCTLAQVLRLKTFEQ